MIEDDLARCVLGFGDVAPTPLPPFLALEVRSGAFNFYRHDGDGHYTRHDVGKTVIICIGRGSALLALEELYRTQQQDLDAPPLA